MNGVKTKFLNNDVKNLFKNFDILIITETHYGIRSRCPEDFLFVCRSKEIKSKKPRGGVAFYINKKCNFSLETLCDSLRECTVVQVKDSNLIIAGIYIPPSNSPYFDKCSFSNLELIYEKYKSSHLIIAGDMNTRIGTPIYDNEMIDHTKNPDEVINENGRKLLNWIRSTQSMIILNGLVYNSKNFESKFTYFRGKVCSQNDYIYQMKLKIYRILIY